MKLTKEEVLNLNAGLESMGELTGVKFAYFISKNLGKLKTEVRSLQKAVEFQDDFLTYDKERVKLAEQYATKDKDGNPSTRTYMKNGKPIQEYQITDQEKFNKELERLQKKYKKAIDARDKQLEEFNTLLKEEIDIDLHTINIDDIPKEINAEQMTSIINLVEDK